MTFNINGIFPLTKSSSVPPNSTRLLKGKGPKILKIPLEEAVSRGLIPSDLEGFMNSAVVAHMLGSGAMLAGGAMRRTLVRGSFLNLRRYDPKNPYYLKTNALPPERFPDGVIGFDLDFFFESPKAEENALKEIIDAALIDNNRTSSYRAVTFNIPKIFSPYDGEITGQAIKNDNSDSFITILKTFDVVNCMLGITKTHFFYSEEAINEIAKGSISFNRDLNWEGELDSYSFRQKRMLKYLGMTEHREISVSNADLILTRILNQPRGKHWAGSNESLDLEAVLRKLIEKASLAALFAIHGKCPLKDKYIDLRMEDYRKNRK